MASVYVHFPWCLAKCPYCDFVSYARAREAIDHARYAGAVVREIELRAAEAGELRIGSVFFGGGTPSLWDPKGLGRVLHAIRARFTCVDDLEVTVECNPTSLDRESARALVAEGVNRLSVGTQSLEQEQLSFLGRLHDPDGARRAVDAALEAAPRVSTDLIFGLPGQSPENAEGQADALAARGLRHLSCYQLTIEPGTRFGELAKRGRLPRAEDGVVADSFLAIDAALSARGLRHYEISNYAAPGEEARHNLGYWHGEPYVGLGCAAYGCLPASPTTGERYRNEIDPEKYMARTLDGEDPTSEREPLDAAALLRERIMLGLRLSEGLDLDAAANDLGMPAWTREREREAARLESMGRLTREGGRLRLTPDAWLWADDTAARLF